jgi:hypothetical protein
VQGNLQVSRVACGRPVSELLCGGNTPFRALRPISLGQAVIVRWTQARFTDTYPELSARTAHRHTLRFRADRLGTSCFKSN